MLESPNFWIAITTLFVIVSLCSMINTSLIKHLDILIPWLTEKFRPILIEAHRPNEARDLTLNRLPILKEWREAGIWYGVIAFTIQILLFVGMFFVSLYNSFPYILALGIACLLGTMITFFPRTLTRRRSVTTAVGLYFLACAELQLQIKNENLIDAINNSKDFGTDPHG